MDRSKEDSRLQQEDIKHQAEQFLAYMRDPNGSFEVWGNSKDFQPVDREAIRAEVARLQRGDELDDRKGPDRPQAGM